MVCKDNLCDYDAFYVDQAGGALDITYYKGIPQTGSGIISTYARRYGFPVAKYLIKHGYQTGKEIYGDVSNGTKFSPAFKKAGKRRVGKILSEFGQKLQTGSGVRKKPNISKRKSRHQSKKRVTKSKSIKRNSTKKRKRPQTNLTKSDIFK